MLHELTEWLDLHAAFLGKQEGIAFLRHLRRTYQSLIGHPQLGPILEALRAEARQIKSAFAVEHDRTVKAFADLKAEVVRLDPPSQDLHAIPPDPDQSFFEHSKSFAMFDKIVSGGGEHSYGIAAEPKTRAHWLAQILQRRLTELVDSDGGVTLVHVYADQQSEIKLVAKRFAEERDRLRYAWNVLKYEEEAHPAFSLLQLDRFIASMLPGPSADAFMDPLLNQAEELVAKWETQYRLIFERIDQELRLRIGTQKSVFALLERFRGRCQWHERAELLRLAKSAGGKPEDKLVSVMARWLYDQGLNPLGQASAGGLRPDLFDPSRRPAIYIEAKQYKESPVRCIKEAVKQIDDTAAQFTAEPYAIREVFLAVFRLDGPLVIPQTLVMRRGAYTLYVVIIDLKPLAKAGSRERESAVQLTERDIAGV